jgi:AAA domain, putative AbiEii toxin, Type IV TA system
MKLFVENLGRIRTASIELRPLTIFVGANNTNKTWTAYSLFGILQALRWNNQHVPPLLERDPAFDSAVARTVADLRARIVAWPDGSRLLETVRRADIFQNLAGPIRFVLAAPEIRNVTMGNIAPLARVTLELSTEEMRAGPLVEMRFMADPEARFLTVEYHGDDVAGGVYALDELERIVREFAMARHGTVCCLPAERKLLSLLSAKILRDHDPLPRPLVDFAYMIALSKVRPDAVRTDILTKLERIVSGRYEMNESTMSFAPTGGGPAFPLTSTASLVKSFAGLAAFLQQARKGDVLLIDEPEMNAHPRAQAQSAELLALLASRGVTVIVTTHSPYFVEHVGNLIEGAALEDAQKTALAESLFLRDPEAFIPASSVATYGFEETPDRSEVVVRELDDRMARSIDWGTFSRVSDAVSNLYGEILDLRREPAQ